MTFSLDESAIAQPMSKTAYVVARLREDIRKGRYPPGTPLLQIEIAARYGVSPTPVREALRILEADWVVEYSDYFGATVRRITEDEIDDLYLLRSVVEGLATQMAVERMRPGDLAELERIHSSIRQLVESGATDVEPLALMNRSLHFAIYSLGSDVITRHIKNLWIYVPSNLTIWQTPTVARQLLEEHEGIMSAMRQGDASGARDLTTEHVLNVSRLRKQVDAESESTGGRIGVESSPGR